MIIYKKIVGTQHTMVLKRELWTSGAIFFFDWKINMNDTECKTLAEELVDNITNILKWEAREEGIIS